MYKVYFAIEKKLHAQGFDFERSELIHQFTEGRKSGLKELTAWEYKELIKWLNQRFDLNEKKQKPQVAPAVSRQRKKIIALLCKLGYVKADDAPDMKRIYGWVLKHGYLSKSLNQYSEQELPKLVYQAEQFYKSHLERL